MKVSVTPEELPTTSVAEFRTAARLAYNYNRPGSITMGIYLTWVALGGAVCVLAFGLAGLAVTPESWWAVLVGVVLLALVVWRIVRVFRRAAEKREQILELGREVDARAARGEIPVAPPGWDRGVPESIDG